MTKIPINGVSLKIKVFVILLTVITVVAFSVFFFKLVSKISSSAKSSSSFKTSSPAKVASPVAEDSWAHELQIVGDKLKKAGLKKQAIEQYSQFLQYTSVDPKTRSQVSQTVAELYIELGDCREALVWLYRAQVAGPSTEQKPVLEMQIDSCLKDISSERP
jgi:hypothetical protein